MTLAEGDVATMIEAWPKLQELSLTLHPFHLTTCGTPLSILGAFTRHFSKIMKHLGLFFVINGDGLMADDCSLPPAF